jgi:lambda family phage portal protein
MSTEVVVYRPEDPAPSQVVGTTFARSNARAPGPVAISGDFNRFVEDQDRDLASFSPSSLSADMELSPSRTRNNARVRALLRRDSYLQNIVNLARDLAVGDQWELDHTPNFRWLGQSEAWADEHSQEVETLWRPYALGLDHTIDVTEKSDLVGLMRQAAATARLYGEVFAVIEHVPERSYREYTTALSLPDPDRISNAYGIANGFTTWHGQRARTRDGIVLDDLGRVLAYNVRESHEGDWWDPAVAWQTVDKLDAASRLQAVLFQDPRRPEQSRGASDLWTCIRQCKVLQKLQTAELGRAVMQAVYAATLESDMPQDLMAKIMTDSSQDALKALAAFLDVQKRYLGGGNGAEFGGNKLISLFTGQKLKLTTPSSSNGTTGTEFERSVLRHLAAAGGVTTEELTGDLSNTNYSSIKAGQSDTNLKVNALRGSFLYPTSQFIFQAWYEEAYSLGHFRETINPVRSLPDLYDGGALAAFTSCGWTGTARSPVDLLKEVQGLALAWKSGIMTFKDVCAYLGKDHRQQLAQMSREIRDFAAAGVPHIMMMQNPTMSALTPRGGTRDDSESGDDGNGSHAQDAAAEMIQSIADAAGLSTEAICAVLANMPQTRRRTVGAGL